MNKGRTPDRSLLIIEPNTDHRDLLFDFLNTRYMCEKVDRVKSAGPLFADHSFGVIVVSVLSAGKGAVELLTSLGGHSPDAMVIVVSENASSGEAIEVFRAGAFDFIPKPFKLEYIEESVSRAFDRFETQSIRHDHRRELEDLVTQSASALDSALADVENSYRVTLKALVQALETRDFETHGHSERVVTFSLRLAFEVGLEKNAMRDLELGALLHDIGKIGVPDAILRKPAKLTKREWEKMKMHPAHGRKILRNIPFLEGAARVVSQHHERWDGKGYPEGIKGESIDLGARIFAVIDAFDAMISDRVYRKGRPYADAVRELDKCSGSQFDPMIVDAFKKVPKEDWEILRERSVKDKQEVFSFLAIVEELVHSRESFELVH